MKPINLHKNIQSFFLVVCMMLSVSLLNGQKHVARVTLKDSSVIEGYARFVDEGKSIHFKKNQGANVQEYSYSQLEKVELVKGGKRKTYTYIKVINQGTVKLAELVLSGKLNLYKFSYEAEGWHDDFINSGVVTTSVDTPNGTIKIVSAGPVPYFDGYGKRTFKDYCVKRKDEEMARFFKDVSTRASFKQMGTYYFKDCPALAARIKNGEFRLKKLPEIVEFYNLNCK